MDSENQIAILQAMLHQIKFDDPKFRLFIRREIGNSYKRIKEKEVTKEIIRRLRIQNKKLLKQVALLKNQVKQLNTEKKEINARMSQRVKLNNSLADALGSCSLCWGENQDCPVCSGNGYSGWRDVNKRLFTIYVLPALEKIHGLKNR